MRRTGVPETPVFVGVDGGGSCVVVRAVAGDGGEPVFASSGGPANALSTPSDLLVRHLDDALRGCPAPLRVGGCFAGLSSPRARAVVSRYFARRFPKAEVRLAPDYVAAVLAAGRSDVCCIAGTGSVCCSLVDGAIRVSGGRGYLLGDPGSAFRYGQALVEHALELPESVPPEVMAELSSAFGTVDRREIVRLVHASRAPAQLLAGVAPALTRCADRGEPWAVELVGREAGNLARAIARHVDRFLPDIRRVHVALVGGVWNSETVRAELTTRLRCLLAPRTLTTDRLGVEPVEGAVTLARLPTEEVGWLGH